MFVLISFDGRIDFVAIDANETKQKCNNKALQLTVAAGSRIDGGNGGSSDIGGESGSSDPCSKASKGKSKIIRRV